MLKINKVIMENNRFINLIRKNSLETNIFYTGIFLLASAPSISSAMLFIAGVISSIKNKSYFKDYWNIPFFFSGLLIFLSCISNSFRLNLIGIPEYEINLLWLGIVNWIPYFWAFWALQNYSNNSIKRKIISLLLLFGSLPVILTGFCQYFFKIHGPFTLFGGLITWYSRPILNYDGMSGLFNNANYTGTWLNIIWPIALILFIESKNRFNQKVIPLLFLISTAACLILTYSRNAWLIFLISSIIILGYKSLRWIVPILIVIASAVLLSIGTIENSYLINLSRNIVPELIWNYRFSTFGLENFSSFGRIEIWDTAIKLIIERPFWGWGAASFPFIFEILNGAYKGHTHNLPLELAVSFGLPVAILIIGTILYIFYISRKNIFTSKNYINENRYDIAWWTSSISIFVSQLFDIQYFDIRIALIFWIFIGGLRNNINIKNTVSKT